tara:strand:- start:622 stop:990 length:369 start_codon:yes stop_codon:yes gene_type:complete
MTLLIILALLLALVQFWIAPMVFSLDRLEYLLSNRDQNDPNESLHCARAKRAAANLQESLPAFLALGVLSLVLQVDNAALMTYWLVLRAAFVVTYIAGLIYIRTLLWLGSLACLIMMALALL